MLDNDQIAALLRRELTEAQGYDADTLASKRQMALNLYTGNTNNRWIPTAPAGRSNIVSSDVRDVHGSILSQIMGCFKTSSIEFEPRSAEDEDQAQLETDVVKLQIDRNGGDKVFYEAVHDALLSGTGWIKVWVDTKEDISRETYTDVDDPVILDQILSEQEPSYAEVISHEGGELKVKRTRVTNKLVIESIDPGQMLFSPSYGQYELQELRFVAERKLYTVAELVELGMTLEDAMGLPSHKEDYWPAVIARDDVTGVGIGTYYDNSDAEAGGKQDATALKECFHCYCFLDIEENGEYERYHVLLGGNEGGDIVLQEPIDHVPYVCGSPLPMPHRVEGQGMAELLYEVQAGKTEILRNYVDNLNVMNSSRLGIVDGQVNVEDLTNGRLNGIVRMKNPTAIVPLPAADVSAQAITGLEYMDKIRTQRGGASLDLNNSNMQVAQSSAAAAIGEYTAKEKMSTLFASNMVNTLMKGTFLLVHHCLRTYMPGPMGAKVRGEWRQTDPGQWGERTHVQTLVGLNSQERKEKLSGLQNLLQIQMGLLQSGGEGVIVSKSNIYNTLADLIRAGELGLPEQYTIDPDSPEGQQAQQQITQNGQQMAQMQARMAQMQTQLEQQKLQLDKYKIDKELQYKYYDTNVDAGLEEAKMTVDNVIKMEQIDATERAAERSASVGSEGQDQ